MAKHEGVLDVEKLYDCYVDGVVMVCDTLINGNYSYEQKFVLSVYNSNLETQHGLILRVPRKYIGLAASRFENQHQRKLKPEVFCFDGQFYKMPEDTCEVYFDIEIHPLQLTHVEITLNPADPTFTKATTARKVFSFSPTDFFDEDDSQEFSVKMKQDAAIEVGGQILSLKKLTTPFDPIELTLAFENLDGSTEMKPETSDTFTFSLNTVEDSNGMQKSGHYSWTVNSRDQVTDEILFIKEVHVTQGSTFARIDLSFTDQVTAHKQIKKCQTDYYTCMRDYVSQDRHFFDFSNTGDEGRITFLLLKNNDKVHQSIELPRVQLNNNWSREVLA